MSFLSFAAEEAANAATNTAVATDQMKSAGLTQVIMIVLMLFFLYFILIRPQKKKEKEAEALRSNIDVGDEIVTIGGIIGTVVSLKDDFIVLESSGDRNKIRIARWAVQTNNTAEERKAKEAEKNRQINKQTKK